MSLKTIEFTFYLLLCVCVCARACASFSAWAAAGRAGVEPSGPLWGWSRGEQRRVHGHSHQGRSTQTVHEFRVLTPPSTCVSYSRNFHSCFKWRLFLTIVLFLKALAKLKKVPETIKAIMERLEPELKQIVKRSTTQIADHAYQRGENLAQESQPRYSNNGMFRKHESTVKIPGWKRY